MISLDQLAAKKKLSTYVSTHIRYIYDSYSIFLLKQQDQRKYCVVKHGASEINLIQLSPLWRNLIWVKFVLASFLKLSYWFPECSMHVGSLTESSSFSIESIQTTIYGHFLCDFEICSYWFLQSVLVCNYFYVIEAYKSAVVKLFFSLILL